MPLLDALSSLEYMFCIRERREELFSSLLHCLLIPPFQNRIISYGFVWVVGFRHAEGEEMFSCL